MGAETRSEYAFKAMFYMQDGEEMYNTIRADLDKALYQQTDFTVSFMHLPKIVHYILSMNRQKYADEIQFSQAQKERVVNTQEYVLTQGWEEQRIAVFLNHRAIRWNESRSQIFACYNRLQRKRENYILNNLLQKFVHISALTADELLYDSARMPVEILYPRADQS